MPSISKDWSISNSRSNRRATMKERKCLWLRPIQGHRGLPLLSRKRIRSLTSILPPRSCLVHINSKTLNLISSLRAMPLRCRCFPLISFQTWTKGLDLKWKAQGRPFILSKTWPIRSWESLTGTEICTCSNDLFWGSATLVLPLMCKAYVNQPTTKMWHIQSQNRGCRLRVIVLFLVFFRCLKCQANVIYLIGYQ